MNRPLRVVYTLPDGAQSTVLLRTDLFRALTRPGHVAWTFVSPLADDREFARAFRQPGIQLRPWPAPPLSFLDRQIQYLRQELWKARTPLATSAIFARRMRWVEPKRYHLHQRLARLGPWLPGIDSLLGVVERLMVREGGWGRLLDEVRPHAMVLGSGGIKLHDVPPGRAAAWRGVPCLGIIPSWDNLTSKGPLPIPLRRLAVWCERLRDEAVTLHGCRAEDVVVTGPPPFDAHHRRPAPADRARFFAALGLDLGRRLITYASVPPFVCADSPGYVELLARLIESGRLSAPCQLLVRLHPQDDFDAFRRLPPRPPGGGQGRTALVFRGPIE